jgi:LmeA-like phospholipid-binding
MSYEPTQPIRPPSPTRQDPELPEKLEESPPALAEPELQESPPTMVDAEPQQRLQESSPTMVDAEPQQRLQESPPTMVDAEPQQSPPTRLEPALPDSPPTRLDPALPDSPPTRLEPQWHPNPQPPQQPQQPQWHPNPQPQQDAQWQQCPQPPQSPQPPQDQRWQQSPQWQQNPQAGQQWQQDRQPAPRWQQEQDDYPDAAPPPRRRRHRVRRSVIALFIIIVLAILLVIANFVGKAVAENDMADQFTANGFPVRPSVNIEGFPFLTQVVAKDFKKVVITASNIPAGPVTISTLNATITGMHLNSSWNGATIDHLTATAFVSLSSLTDGISNEIGGAVSLTAVPDGPNKLKITGSLLGASTSGVVEIKQTGPQQITIELPTSGGLVGTLLGSAASFPINLPAGVPPSLRITGLSLNGKGLTLSAAATNATFSK